MSPFRDWEPAKVGLPSDRESVIGNRKSVADTPTLHRIIRGIAFIT